MKREFEQLLEQEALGDLDAAGRIRLETLAASNPEFARQLRQERNLTGLLRAHGPNNAPAGLARRVFAELDNHGQARRPEPVRWWANPLLGWAACAAVVAVVLIRPLLDPQDGPRSVASTPPPVADSPQDRVLASAPLPQLDATPTATPAAPIEAAGSSLPEASPDDSLFMARAESLSIQSLEAGLPEDSPSESSIAAGSAPAPQTEPLNETSVARSAATETPADADTAGRLGERGNARAIASATTPQELTRARLSGDLRDDTQQATKAKPTADNATPAPATAPGDLRVLASSRPAEATTARTPRVALRITLGPRSVAGDRAGQATQRPQARPNPADPNALVRQSLGSTGGGTGPILSDYSQKDIEIAVLMAGGKIVKREGTPGPGQASQIGVVLNPEQMRRFLELLEEMGIRQNELSRKQETVPARGLSQQYEVVEGEAVYRMIEKGMPAAPKPAEAPVPGQTLDMATSPAADGSINLSLTIQRAEE